MENTENIEVGTAIEATGDPAITAPATRRRAAEKPPVRVKPRSLEELDSMPAKHMTEAEKILYIEECRINLTAVNNINSALNENCKAAYKQYQNADDAYVKLKAETDSKLAFCRQIADTMKKSIDNVGGIR